MNKDKMKLEEAIQELQERIEMLDRHIKNYEESNCKTNIYLQLVKEKQATETVLQELENKNKQIKELKAVNAMQEYRINEMDIPKKKVEDKIEELNHMLYSTTEGKLRRYKAGELIAIVQFCQELLEE